MGDDRAWEMLLRARRGGAVPPGGHPLAELFRPVLAPPLPSPPRADAASAPAGEPDGCFVLGRLAQSLDGRIATRCGNSRWIGGPGDLRHTHRLRALCDAVVVGAGTVALDDPRLTTREVPGPDPVRVVLDPRRRLGDGFGVFRGGPPTLLACHDDAPHPTLGAAPGAAELLPLPAGDFLPALLRTLAARGLRRVFVEGGGVTVSRFLAEGLLDRLHLTVAPLILGSGRPAFTLPDAAAVSEGLRFRWTVHPLGDDVLFDVPLNRARPASCERAPGAPWPGPHHTGAGQPAAALPVTAGFPGAPRPAAARSGA